MEMLKILPVNGIRLSIDKEIKLTQIITKLVKLNSYYIFCYNSCSDHIHFIIGCNDEKLDKIIRTIKSYSSKYLKLSTGISHLWAQKFNRVLIENEKQLNYAFDYIKNNRIKHNLPYSKELEDEIRKMITPFENIEEILDKVEKKDKEANPYNNGAKVNQDSFNKLY